MLIIRCILMLGLCDGNIKIISLQNLWLDEGDNCFYADSFTLSIPYAGSSLLWEIIFCRDDVAFTVDIMVDDESFQHSLKQNKNLDWNPHNSNSLINLIKEYITLYKQHNVSYFLVMKSNCGNKNWKCISD